MKKKPVISEDLADFLQSGISFTVATRDDDLEAEGARAWAARIHDDRLRLTLFLHKPAGGRALKNLRANPEIAVCADRPTDNCCCQLKGRFVSSRAARAAERADVERQVEGFLGELDAIGIPRAMTAGWAHWPCTAIEMRVDEIFEQTPGPGAGEPLPPDTMPSGTAPPGDAP